MRNPISRRKAVGLLGTAFVPIAAASKIESQTAPQALSINGADSILYCLSVLDKVRGDIFSHAYRVVVDLYMLADTALRELRVATQELRQEIAKRNQNWPVLQKRFGVITDSLEAAASARPGEVKQRAIEAMPATLDSLKSVIKEVSATCTAAIDDPLNQQIDKALTAVATYDEALAQVNTAQAASSTLASKLDQETIDCRKQLENAADFIERASKGQEGSKARATDCLKSAEQILADMRSLSVPLPAPAAPPSQSQYGRANSALTLHSFLVAIRVSLEAPAVQNVSFGDTNDKTPPPSYHLADNSNVLINLGRVINDRSCFRPGSTLQFTFCLMLCGPIWAAYRGAQNEADRKEKIFGLLEMDAIWGVVGEHSMVAGRLAEVYELTQAGRTA